MGMPATATATATARTTTTRGLVCGVVRVEAWTRAVPIRTRPIELEQHKKEWAAEDVLWQIKKLDFCI